MSSGTVCVTFDFDAVSLWIQRKQVTPTPVSRGEFGAVAVPRILNLLDSRNVKSTWFIPGHTVETYPKLCKEIVDAGHEIGLHGYAHENASELDEKQERQMFLRALDILGNLIGESPKGNRSPSWDLTAHSANIMMELGITYDSSLMSRDYAPFYVRQGDEVTDKDAMKFGKSTNLIEVPVSWSLDDYPAFEYVRMSEVVMPGLRKPEDVFANWMGDLTYMLRDFVDGVLVVTFHPQVIGRGHRMLGLEAWLDQLHTADIEFEKLGVVAEEFDSGRPYGTYHPHR